LLELPQDEQEIWHVDVRPLRISGADDEDAWGLFVTSPTLDQVVVTDFMPEKPANAKVLQRLAKIMLAPPEGHAPRRPAVIHVRLKTHLTSWGSKLRAAGIACRQVPTLDDVVQLLLAMSESMQRRLAGSVAPPLSDDDLKELPQVPEETWQADARLLAMWIGNEGQPRRPWCAIVTNRTEGTIQTQSMTIEQPSPDWLAVVVRQAMSHPSIGEPHRPGTVEVVGEPALQQLKPLLDKLNIHSEVAEQLDHLDFVLDDLTRHMAGEHGPPALLDAPGVGPSEAGRFYEAAAAFYQAKPWRSAPADVPIKVECRGLASSPWYAIIMGQNGMVEGLALCEDFELLQRTISGRLSEAENARRTSALTIDFNEAFDIHSLDLYNIERHGWPTAGPEAYPKLFRVQPGLAIRAPLAWELQLVTACLRALPEFLRRVPDASTATPLPIAVGEHELLLSWAAVV